MDPALFFNRYNTLDNRDSVESNRSYFPPLLLLPRALLDFDSYTSASTSCVIKGCSMLIVNGFKFSGAWLSPPVRHNVHELTFALLRASILFLKKSPFLTTKNSRTFWFSFHLINRDGVAPADFNNSRIIYLFTGWFRSSFSTGGSCHQGYEHTAKVQGH